MSHHHTSIHWLRRTFAALLVLCMLALHGQTPAAVTEDAADTATWLVLQSTATAAPTATPDSKPEPTPKLLQPQSHPDEQDPPCWGDVIEALPFWPMPPWLTQAPPAAHCPPLQPLLLPTPERPPRA